MIELGGNITLHGFQDRDYAELIVVKKIVGRYARQISDQHEAADSLTVTLKPADGKLELVASCSHKGKGYRAEATESNLFVALDSALKKMVQQLS